MQFFFHTKRDILIFYHKVIAVSYKVMVISLLIEYVENVGACWIMKNKKLVKAKFS